MEEGVFKMKTEEKMIEEICDYCEKNKAFFKIPYGKKYVFVCQKRECMFTCLEQLGELI